MKEYAIELASQPRRPHIAMDMFALGVQGAAHREHPRRKIHQSHLELPLEVRRVVPSAATELDHCA